MRRDGRLESLRRFSAVGDLGDCSAIVVVAVTLRWDRHAARSRGALFVALEARMAGEKIVEGLRREEADRDRDRWRREVDRSH